jgi:hypothetical protein
MNIDSFEAGSSGVSCTERMERIEGRAPLLQVVALLYEILLSHRRPAVATGVFSRVWRNEANRIHQMLAR